MRTPRYRCSHRPEIGPVASIVSAIVAVIALVLKWREKCAAGDWVDAAAESAERSTSVAEQFAYAQTKMAEIAQAAAAKYVPPWRFEHDRKDTYVLWNTAMTTRTRWRSPGNGFMADRSATCGSTREAA